MHQKPSRVRTVVAPAIALVVGLALWELAAWLFSINPIIFPPPHEIGFAIADNALYLLFHGGITMFEAILGFCLGSIAAYLLAIVFVHSDLVRVALYPYAVALKSTPLIALAPIIVLWFGNGVGSKVVMAALVAFFPVLVNSVTGLTAVPQEVLDLMRSLSATRLQVLIKIRIPSSLSYLFASLRIASSLAVVGAVIGEFTGSTRGIGFVINTSSYYLRTPLMFAAVVTIAFGGVLLFSLVGYVERHVVFWKQNSESEVGK